MAGTKDSKDSKDNKDKDASAHLASL